MTETLLIEHQNGIRLGSFLLLLAVLVGLEGLSPRRARPVPQAKRRFVNAALLLLGALALRLLPSLLPVGVALQVQARQLGLLPWLSLPWSAQALITIVALDFVVYLQHVLLHKAPLLWRVHRVHHTDVVMDVSTGLRFHPLEILLSALLKAAAVVVLGAGALAVLCYEVLLNAAAMFTHSNLHLPARLDALLRWVFVTPDMHRVHHSQHRFETDSNYGNLLSCWDRCFKTYVPAPRDGHTGMRIGLRYARDAASQTLAAQLWLPFRGEAKEAD